MIRSLSALTAALVVAGVACGADAKKLTIRWHGQSFFEIETTQGTKLVTDPHGIEAFGRKVIPAHAATFSHFHNDHTQTFVLEKADPKKDIQFFPGLKAVNKQLTWNLIDGKEGKFKDVQLRTVPLYHDNVNGMDKGLNSAFIIEADGLRICHLGDLGHLLTENQLKSLLSSGPIDVLMIPVGGVYTINGGEARKVVEQIKPRRYILPMHYGTKVYDDLLKIDEFLEDQKKGTVRKMEDTNKLEITPDAKPPESPFVIVLGWEERKKDK